jgi:hypothetical protein
VRGDMVIQWGDITVGVAAIIGLIYVARTLRRTVNDTLGFVGNHMSANTEALIEVRVALEKVVDRLERVENTVRQHSNKKSRTAVP